MVVVVVCVVIVFVVEDVVVVDMVVCVVAVDVLVVVLVRRLLATRRRMVVWQVRPSVVLLLLHSRVRYTPPVRLLAHPQPLFAVKCLVMHVYRQKESRVN